MASIPENDIKTQSTLLSLPAEILNRTCEAVFNGTVRSHRDLSLLLACRQTYRDAHFLPYTISTWHIGAPAGRTRTSVSGRLQDSQALNTEKFNLLATLSLSLSNTNGNFFPFEPRLFDGSLHIKTLIYHDIGTLEPFVRALGQHGSYLFTSHYAWVFQNTSPPATRSDGVLNVFCALRSLETLVLQTDEQTLKPQLDEHEISTVRQSTYAQIAGIKSMMQGLRSCKNAETAALEECWELRHPGGFRFQYLGKSVSIVVR
ncbi:hypothetical protein LTS18_002855 [Coniosporium uncinatum]|uniref:Uncharacterized protein n=1 Tax=Coniosporium uncinatum TaxID=93489 RepID=A0ACC3DBV0_9PEZI|nr:hypothetical protein LTS18_002855 [Coniosporium uncinatum]